MPRGYVRSAIARVGARDLRAGSAGLPTDDNRRCFSETDRDPTTSDRVATLAAGVYCYVRGPDRHLRGEPLSARIALDQPTDGVWPSDHFAIVADILAPKQAHDPY